MSYATHEVIYTSIQSVSPRADDIIARHEKEFSDRISRLTDDPERVSWLKAQLEIQLAGLKNPNYPEIEFMFCPYLFGSPSTYIHSILVLSNYFLSQLQTNPSPERNILPLRAAWLCHGLEEKRYVVVIHSTHMFITYPLFCSFHLRSI